MSVNTILLKDMPFSLIVGTDAWRRPGKPQPVKINFEVHNVHIIEDAALADDVNRSLDYGKLYKSIQRRMEAVDSFTSVRRVAEALLSTLTGPNVTATGEIELAKAALRAEGGLVYSFEEDRNPRALSEYETLSIRGIRCYCILGVNPHERRDKQLVDVRIDFHDLPTVGNVLDDYHELIPAVVEVCFLVFKDYGIPDVSNSLWRSRSTSPSRHWLRRSAGK